MGCNTSQEPAPATSVENDTAAKVDPDSNAANADAEIKSENGKTINEASHETPMANGDPLGKDEGEFMNKRNFFLFFPLF